MWPTLYLSGMEVYAYSFFMGLGYACGLPVIYFRRKVTQVKMVDILVCYALAGILALLGGKVASMLRFLPTFMEQFAPRGYTLLDMYNFSGSIFYGILFGALLGVFIYTKLYRRPYWTFLDTLVPVIALVQTIGRIGCFFQGCCYGIPWEHGLYFSASGTAPHDVRLLPLQLIESAGCFAIFILMVRLGRKPLPPGKMLGSYFVLYGCMRIVLEFFRGDGVSAMLGPMSSQQWISVGLAIVGILLVRYANKQPEPGQE
jgi:phosphatidylglycerol:prolipoprotein diacylglycerol transferase